MDDKKLLQNLQLTVGSRPAVSDRTVIEYERRIKMLLIATKKKTLVSAITGNVGKSFAAIAKAHEDITTQRNILTMVLSVYGHSPDFAKAHAEAHDTWMARHRELGQIEKKENDNNVMTEKMRSKMPTQEEMAAALNLLRPQLDKLNRSQQYLLVRLFKDHPPKRLDFGSLKVLRRHPSNTAPAGNFIVVPPKGAVSLVMQEYKTATGKPFEEQFPTDISDDIRESLRAHPREHLFTGKGGAPLTEAAYGMYVRRTFLELTGKSAGVSALRHAYISAHCNPMTATSAQLESIATSMNHSKGMQQMYHVVDTARKDI